MPPQPHSDLLLLTPFTDFSDPAHPESRAFDVEGDPIVELEYPNTNAREK